MKILIVEDNMILCGMIEKWLQKAGYEVLTAMDEPGARSILKKVTILFSALTRMFPKPTFAP